MKKKISTMLLCLLLSLGFSLVTTTPAAAATINVPSDYATVQLAINAAAPGDTIMVAAGTYTEQVTITKSLNLIGAGEATTIIQAPSAPRSGSVTQGSYAYDYIIAAYHPTDGTIDVRIEGFTIDANNQNKTSGTDYFVGVFFRDVSGSSNAGLFSSTIQGFPATPEYESYGVKVYGNSLLTIDDNTISSYTRDGIGASGDAYGNPDITISNNQVTGSAVPLNAISVIDGASGSITGNTVQEHTRSSPWAACGILIDNSDGITVTGNTVENTFYAIDIVGSTSSTVSDNTLTDNINRHIMLDNSTNCQVSGNTINGSGGTEDAAINLLNGSSGNTIGGDSVSEGNTITLVTSDSWAAPPNLYCIWLGGGTTPAGSNTIQYNVISGGKRGIQVDSGTTGTVTIANNTISNTPTGPNYPIWGIGFMGGDADITSNTLTNTVRPIEFWGAANINVDGNTIDGAIFDGINLGSASGTRSITNNIIYNVPSGYGIHIQGGNSNAVIDGNEIYQSYSGILTDSGVSDTQITNNYIHDNTYGSILINDAAGTIATLTGNTIQDNERGIEANPGGGTIVAHFNDLVDNTYGGLFLYSSGTFTFDNNWWGVDDGPNVDGSGPGTGASIVTNGNTVLTYTPWLTAGVTSAKTETITDDTIDAKDEADTEVVVTGGPVTITVAQYSSNPGSSSFAGDIGKYIDVQIQSGSATEIEVRLYYTSAEIAGLVESSLVLYWWDGTAWSECSDSGVNTTDTNGYSGYIWARIDNETSPSLADLTGAPFGAYGNSAPSSAGHSVGGEVYPINKMVVLAPWLGLAGAIIAGAYLLMRHRSARRVSIDQD